MKEPSIPSPKLSAPDKESPGKAFVAEHPLRYASIVSRGARRAGLAKRCATPAVLVALLVFGTAAEANTHNPDALWQIVRNQCLPAARAGKPPAPCDHINPKEHYALLKDLAGPLQYLLIPTRRISGIESPILLDPSTTHFFADAWRERTQLSKRYGDPIPDDDILLALNSPHGRSQNQLHIHIDCIDPRIKKKLVALANDIDNHWAALPASLAGHRYIARRVTIDQLQQAGAFSLLAEYDHARAHMSDYGLAMTQVAGAGLVLLATRLRRGTGNFASPEELESHRCEVLPHSPTDKKNRAGPRQIRDAGR